MRSRPGVDLTVSQQRRLEVIQETRLCEQLSGSLGATPGRQPYPMPADRRFTVELRCQTCAAPFELVAVEPGPSAVYRLHQHCIHAHQRFPTMSERTPVPRPPRAVPDPPGDAA